MNFVNWNTQNGEPNNKEGDENCVQLQSISSGGKWNDQSCKSQNYFVCEDDII